MFTKGSSVIYFLIIIFLTNFANGEFSYVRFKKENNDKISENLFGSDCLVKGQYKDSGIVAPTISISVFVRNKEHSLPYFLQTLLNFDYPNKRISLWFVADHNRDNSIKVLQKWLDLHKDNFHSTQLDVDDSEIEYEGQKADTDWTEERYTHILKLRQKALEKAKEEWADYALFLDADNLLMNPCSLWHLISADQEVVAPMLDTVSTYSNYWCDYNKDTGYYLRSDDYLPIRHREKLGVFPVALVHSTFLIDLSYTKSRFLKFWPPGKEFPYRLDDFVVMVWNFMLARIRPFIDNSQYYGYLPVPIDSASGNAAEVSMFVHTLHELMTPPPVGYGLIPERDPDLGTNLLNGDPINLEGFDKIYMINLVRRPDRFILMEAKLKMLGIEYEHFHAIDAKQMNNTYLKSLGVQMLEGYVDPYRDRPLTYGEIGCFLSHYFIWKDIVEKGYKNVIIFEDDVRFEPNFLRGMDDVWADIESNKLEWDLIYLGRKKMRKTAEHPVEGTNNLVWSGYSYWTVGYLISNSGAEKLLAGKPLEKMVPVDEYIPIMFDQHPKEQYWKHFPIRNLKGMSVEPLLIYPTHYTGQENHYSDTETSVLMYDEEKKKKEEL